MKYQILLLFSLFNYIKTHSWLECTSYQINSEEDTYYWDKSKCFGYPRGFTHQHEAGFGQDTGFNVNGGIEGRHTNGGCAANLENTYNSQIKRATYISGQKVCLAYPAKNHVADTCTNIHIPDMGVIITRGTIVDINTFNSNIAYQHKNGVHTKGQIDYKGYQKCPKFCENMDKSLCTMCFDLENDIEPGVYSFKWAWEFNPNEFYYSCWDAEVVNSNDDTPKITPPLPCPTMKECPGLTGVYVVSLEHCPEIQQPIGCPDLPTECPDLPNP